MFGRTHAKMPFINIYLYGVEFDKRRQRKPSFNTACVILYNYQDFFLLLPGLRGTFPTLASLELGVDLVDVHHELNRIIHSFSSMICKLRLHPAVCACSIKKTVKIIMCVGYVFPGAEALSIRLLCPVPTVT